MKFYDAHIHYIGKNSVDLLNKTVETSKYKNIFLGYVAWEKSINIDEHIKSCAGGFVMPYCLKELSPSIGNEELINNFSTHKSMNMVPFISTNVEDFVDFDNFVGYKEHFYIHNCFQWAERDACYKYLNDKKKLLILHCDNINRIDYVRFLCEKYPDMIIQIAHLGRFPNSFDASKLVLKELSDLKQIYFDVSATFDSELLRYATSLAEDRILFGTDVPYVYTPNYMEKYEQIISRANLSDICREKLMTENYLELISKIKH